MSNLYVYLMRSRNKDIPNFNERVKNRYVKFWRLRQ